MTVLPRSPGGWRNLLYVLTGLTGLLFLGQAFLQPGSLQLAPFAIQDDARQFLTWMPRLTDAALLRGDLLAEYWQSVSPALFRWIYGAAALAGLHPVLFSKLLPLLLLAVSVYATWRVAERLTASPAAAFVAAGLVMALLIHEDSIYSASPRAFSPPLFLLFLDGLLRSRPLRMILSLGVLAAIYPTTALVGLTMLGLSKLRLRPRPGIDLSRASILLVGAATLAVAIPVLALPGQTERWEPVLTVEQAVAMPNLGTAGGRSSIVSADGSVGWLCSARMGVLPEIVPCWATRWAVLPNALFLVPLLVLAWRAARAPPTGGAWPGDLIYLWALVAGVAWWAVATLFAFKLHLPARYPQRVLSILEWLAIGQMLGNWLSARLGTKSASTGPKVAAGILGLLLLISFATPTPGIRRPSDPDALRAIAALPPGAVVAGLSADLDFVPALAGRSTLATVEHAIPYHWGYFGEVDRRLRATVAAAATPNPEDLAAFIRRERVSAFVIDQAALEQGRVPVSYAGVVHAAVQQADAEFRRQPSALQRLAPACTIHRGKVLVLDGPCLAGRPATG